MTLKPCPFCGVVPRIYWEPWKDISETAGIYVLEANHKNECYIPSICGMNATGMCISKNETALINTWNRRFNEE